MDQDTLCFKGGNVVEHGIIHLCFRKTPQTDEQFHQFLGWLSQLLFYNPISKVKETSLVVELNTVNLSFAWNYAKRLREFLQTEQTQHRARHTTKHVRTCLVTPYSTMYKFLIESITNNTPYSVITWHSNVEEALQSMKQAQAAQKK
jgi:hypothetical protein